MSQEEMPSLQLLHSSTINQKVQMIYKLFLLENCRTAAQQDLDDFSKQAYEDAQAVFNASLPYSEFTDIIKKLDVKCQLMQKISALLKGCPADMQDGFQTEIRNEVKTNQVNTILKTEAVRVEPILKNSLMTNSIAKPVQVVEALVSPQQLKPSPPSQAATIQQDDMMSTASSNFNSTILTTGCPSSLKTEEQQVAFDENSQPDPKIVPSVITQSHEISSERPQLLHPIQALRPEISNPKPRSTTPLISWERQGDVQVQHQKQTSSQLLLFLREQPQTEEAVEVSVTDWNKSTYAFYLPPSTSPAMKSQSYQDRHVVTDDLGDAPAAKSLRVNMENQSPVFRVKRAESGGSVVYSCVITTETELWDCGDILTAAVRKDSELISQGRDDNRDVISQVDDPCVSDSGKTLHRTEAADISAKNLTINSVNIPQFQFKRFEELEVVVSHVVNPGNFYIQHADSPDSLQPLITDSWKASSSYAEQNCIPDLGTRVMALIPTQQQWCRAQVMKICGVSVDKDPTDDIKTKTTITMEVMRLDYGDTACVSLWNIKELTPELAAVPLQALQVSLANVTPVNGSLWSEESVGWFRTMVHNRTLYARLYPQWPNIEVELFLEKGNLGAMRRGASLSLRLAQNGHANHSKLKNTALMKKRAAKAPEQESDWVKQLISNHYQIRK